LVKMLLSEQGMISWSLLGELGLIGWGDGEAEPLLPDHLDDGVIDLLLPVTQAYGPVTAHQVYVLVPVHVPHPAPLARLEEDGIFALDEVPRVSGAHHTAGDDALCPFEKLHVLGQVQLLRLLQFLTS